MQPAACIGVSSAVWRMEEMVPQGRVCVRACLCVCDWRGGWGGGGGLLVTLHDGGTKEKGRYGGGGRVEGNLMGKKLEKLN